SVQAHDIEDLAGLQGEVEDVVTDMEALRLALRETERDPAAATPLPHFEGTEGATGTATLPAPPPPPASPPPEAATSPPAGADGGRRSRRRGRCAVRPTWAPHRPGRPGRRSTAGAAVRRRARPTPRGPPCWWPRGSWSPASAGSCGRSCSP